MVPEPAEPSSAEVSLCSNIITTSRGTTETGELANTRIGHICPYLGDSAAWTQVCLCTQINHETLQREKGTLQRSKQTVSGQPRWTDRLSLKGTVRMGTSLRELYPCPAGLRNASVGHSVQGSMRGSDAWCCPLPSCSLLGDRERDGGR